jgi:hypothetical protein
MDMVVVTLITEQSRFPPQESRKKRALEMVGNDDRRHIPGHVAANC